MNNTVKFNPLYAAGIIRTLSETQEILIRAVETDVVAMVWGPSGVGKSRMIEQLVLDRDYAMQITLSLGSRDPLDFTGIPSIAEGRTITNDPMLIPLAKDVLPEGIRLVIVFVDELPEGDVPTLKAVYRMLNERMINNEKVHPAVRFICAGNQAKDGAFTAPLIPTVANRMMHIVVKLCPHEWLLWATKAGVNPVQRAFIAFDSSYLSTYDPKSAEDAFATPRTHERLNAFMRGDKFTDETKLARGAPVQFLGKKAGLALLNFAENNSFPDVGDILNAPTTFSLSTLTAGSMFILGQALISAATPDTIVPILILLERMAPNHKAICFMGLRALPKAEFAALIQVPEFVDFTARNYGLLTIANQIK